MPDMTDNKMRQEFLEEMRLHIAETIRTTVNGKIAALDEKLTKKLDAQNESMKPVIETFNNLKWGKNVIIGVIGFLAALGGLVLIYKNIRNE